MKSIHLLKKLKLKNLVEHIETIVWTIRFFSFPEIVFGENDFLNFIRFMKTEGSQINKTWIYIDCSCITLSLGNNDNQPTYMCDYMCVCSVQRAFYVWFSFYDNMPQERVSFSILMLTMVNKSQIPSPEINKK